MGRTGDAWRTWLVDPRPGERWATEFEVPMDASFIGLRGSQELERQVKHISLTPLAIVDWSRRPKLPTVLGAAQFGSTTIFYHDERAFPERTGFWVQGERSTLVTIQRDNTTGPLTLRVHSGLIDNRLHVATAGWQSTRALDREQPDVVEIPSGDRRVVTIELSADKAFVPKEVTPSSVDSRPLGVWVEVITP
jgi:hypothetical protein